MLHACCGDNRVLVGANLILLTRPFISTVVAIAGGLVTGLIDRFSALVLSYGIGNFRQTSDNFRKKSGSSRLLSVIFPLCRLETSKQKDRR